MKIAIHHHNSNYSHNWIEYCTNQNIDFKIVNCYDSDIINQLADCDGLMWHFHHANPKDIIFARQLLYSLQCSGKAVFPDFNTVWHFDDKVGQKYLFESVAAPHVPSYVFYTKREALEWIKKVDFPKVFKLRKGASGDNVRLVKTRWEALRLINKAFGTGFRFYAPLRGLNERLIKFKQGKTDLRDIVNGLGRFVIRTNFERIIGKEKGYVFFQDFIPDNRSDIRIVYVNNRCWGFRRIVRPGDFRASGSGLFDFDLSHIPEKAIKIAFEVSTRLKLQSAALDFVMFNGEPIIIELSYAFGGFAQEQFEQGYWDRDLNLIKGSFNPYNWMVEGLIESINSSKSASGKIK